MNDFMISVRRLRRTFRGSDGTLIEAVRGIDLDVPSGTIFSLLGPNGAGKTTTISMICGLLPPTEGDAAIGGHSVIAAPLKAKRLLGIVPQEIALYPNLSAKQNLRFFGRMYGLGGKSLTSRVDELLDLTDLTDRADDRIESYSGGMQRRINFACGLLHEPRLLFLDEPTVGIDPQSRRRILDLIVELKQTAGMTVLYTTHQMEEAQEISDSIAIMDEGRIVAHGTQDELVDLIGREDEVRLELDAGPGDPSVSPDAIVETLQTLMPEVRATRPDAQTIVVTVRTTDGRRALPTLLRRLERADYAVRSVEIREPNLESVFLALTGRELRD